MDDGIVVGGISGRFPESATADEFWTNLANGVDMVTANDRRWQQGFSALPKRKGTLKNLLEEFDSDFFGIHRKQAERLDPRLRQLLEVTWEAIFDGGVNPVELRGQAIGVYVGVSSQETIEAARSNPATVSSYDVPGSAGCMFANRVSFAFDFRGPSACVDTYCSSSLMALHMATKAIRNGECDGAIVGGINLLLNPFSSLQIHALGVLSEDGKCKSFDASGNGYVQSETIAAVYITKNSLARRCYATIVNTKTNTDGYKTNGLTFPSGSAQELLMRQTYAEVGLRPEDVYYVEAHGTGTAVGDVQELQAISTVYCPNRSASTPLLIGSTKSNMGHAEAAAGVASLIKVVLSVNRNLIPPNLHFCTPNPAVPELLNGKLKVVTEATPLCGDLFGISGFGLGGTNVHVILKREVNPPAETFLPVSATLLPTFIPFSARAQEAVEEALQKITKRHDIGEIHLLKKIHEKPIANHKFRGFSILGSDKPISLIQELIEKRPFWIIFPGMGTQWAGMGRDVMEIDTIRQSIQKSAAIMKPFGIDVLDLIVTQDEEEFTKHAITAYTIMGIALVDFIKSLNLAPDGFIGHSAGEALCAYFDGCWTHEEALLCQYHKEVLLAENPGNCACAMASVGLSWEEANAQCPEFIFPACHNAEDNVTLAGPELELTTYVEQLKSKGIFGKIVPTGGMAFHSPYVSHICSKLEVFLRTHVQGHRSRSPKWISTVHEQNDTPHDETSFNPEYILRQFESPVRFHSAVKRIPSNAVVLEVGSHSLFQNILKRSLPASVTLIPTMMKNGNDNITRLYTAVGLLFINGFQPKLTVLTSQRNQQTVEKLARNTRSSISSLVKWDHSQKFPLLNYISKSGGENVFRVSLVDAEWEFLKGHKIDGRILFPATGYLVLTWKAYANMLRKSWKSFGVKFENVEFHRATVLNIKDSVEFSINIFENSGKFQICESKSIVASGMIQELGQNDRNFLATNSSSSELVLPQKDIYKDFRLRGYEYTEKFQGILSSTITGDVATVCVQPEPIAFLDTLLQVGLISLRVMRSQIYLPTRIKTCEIDAEFLKNSNTVDVHYCSDKKSVSATCVLFDGVTFRAVPKRKTAELNPSLQSWSFVPYISTDHAENLNFNDALKICVDLVLENNFKKCLNVHEVTSQEILPTLIDKVQELVQLWPERDMCSNLEKSLDVAICQTFEDFGQHEKIFENISETGFALFITTRPMTNLASREPCILVASKMSQDNFFYLLRKARVKSTEDVVIPVENTSYAWLPKLQEAMTNATDDSRVWLTSDNLHSGLVGLVNCLRKEPGGDKIRCIVAPFSKLFISDAMKKADLVMNIFDEASGMIGSYRSNVLVVNAQSRSAHAYLDVLHTGDMSSIEWIEAPKPTTAPNGINCTVHFAPLNFRDIMLATGKLSREALPGEAAKDECVLGLEFCGTDEQGNRVMGVVASKSLATHVQADPNFMWNVPHSWSLAEASTIPVAYSTAYYALILRGKLQHGESVLITSGTGGVGQAAITLALSLNCQIFTTVGSTEKKIWLHNKFHKIDQSHILSSQSTEFAEEILKLTKGRGVNVVLNSLAEEKLTAALSCLAKGGRFLEIGKFDLSKNTPLGMEIFLKNISLHGILIDALFSNDKEAVVQKRKLVQLVLDGISCGVVQPLPLKIFDYENAQDAFRFMASGKHIGKVVLRMRNEDEQPQLIKVVSRTYFDSTKMYVVFGGLGGFGLEMVSWMVTRGVRKVAVVSRNGVSNGYQRQQISRWEKAGANVIVENNEFGTLADVESFLAQCKDIGPVGGIFNLAMVLRDGLLENQRQENFNIVLKPKHNLTSLLDRASRKCCLHLDYFVVFSSVSSVFGNAGQSNYGFANSSMEQICARRVKDGLHGLAIAWGAIGDVGIVHEHMHSSTSVAGTIPQPLTSCIQTLDTLLHHKFRSHRGVVSSLVHFRDKSNATEGGNVKTEVPTLKQRICGLLGLTAETIETRKDSTLAELGLDSLLVVEAKQIFAEMTKFENVSTLQIRSFTWQDLEDFQN